MFGISKLLSFAGSLTLGAAGSLLGSAHAIKRGSGQVYAWFFYLLTGAAILFMGFWWTRSAYDWFAGSGGTPPLGEVLILGKADAEATALARSVPAMVIAELRELQNTINDALAALSEFAGEVTENNPLRPSATGYENIKLPNTQIEPLDIELKVADVDYGKTLSSLFNLANTDHQIRLVVSFDDGMTRFYGAVPNDPNFSFSGSLQGGGVPEVALAISSSIMQKSVAQIQTPIGEFDRDQLKKLVNALSKYKKLRSSRGRALDDLKSDFQATFKEVSPLADDWTGIPELQLFAARLAESAEYYPQSITYYSNVLIAAQLSGDQKQTVEDTIKRLAALIKPPSDVQNSFAKAAGFLPDDRATPIWKAIGMAKRGSAGKVKIGIVSSTPWDEVINKISVSPKSQIGKFANPGSQDYATNILQTVRIVAGDGVYSFQGPSDIQTSEDEIVASLSALYSEGASVILLTYGGIDQSKIMDLVASEAKANTIIVLPAGNEGQKTEISAVKGNAAVISATDIDGTRAEFTNYIDDGLYAPGLDLPIFDLRDGTITTWSGTGPAAAVATGAIAVLQNEFPEVEAVKLVKVLRDTSVRQRNEGPAIINVEAARKALRGGSE